MIWLKFDFGWDDWLARLVGLRCTQIVGHQPAVHEMFGPLLRRARPGSSTPASPTTRRDAERGRELHRARRRRDPAGPLLVALRDACVKARASWT